MRAVPDTVLPQFTSVIITITSTPTPTPASASFSNFILKIITNINS